MQMKMTEAQHSQCLEENEKTAKVLRTVILYLMSNQLAINAKLDGACTVETIVKRLYHDRLVGYNNAIYDESLTLWDRVKAYATNKMDAAYGRAIASRFGFTLEDGNGYDVNRYPGDMRIMLRGDDLYEFCYYLMSIGAVAQNQSICRATDGINHINIYSKGRTALGKYLSMFQMCDVWYTTPHGKFKTLEGYYHFLRILEYYEYVDGKPIEEWAKDPRLMNSDVSVLKHADGSEAIRYGRKLKKEIYGGTGYQPGYFTDRALGFLIVALIHKLQTPKDNECWVALKRVCDAGIPLVHYYVMDGTMKQPSFSEFIPDLYKAIADYIDPESDKLNAEWLISNVDQIVKHYHRTTGARK